MYLLYNACNNTILYIVCEESFQEWFYDIDLKGFCLCLQKKVITKKSVSQILLSDLL